MTNAKGIKGVSCPVKAYGIMAANVPMSASWAGQRDLATSRVRCGRCRDGDYEGIRTSWPGSSTRRMRSCAPACGVRSAACRGEARREVRALEEAMS
ncbi:MAG: hypothetical protein ACLTMP_13175 [Eggerthella lenta]